MIVSIKWKMENLEYDYFLCLWVNLILENKNTSVIEKIEMLKESKDIYFNLLDTLDSSHIQVDKLKKQLRRIDNQIKSLNGKF